MCDRVHIGLIFRARQAHTAGVGERANPYNNTKPNQSSVFREYQQGHFGSVTLVGPCVAVLTNPLAAISTERKREKEREREQEKERKKDQPLWQHEAQPKTVQSQLNNEPIWLRIWLVGLHATTLTKTFQQKSENEWKRET